MKARIAESGNRPPTVVASAEVARGERLIWAEWSVARPPGLQSLRAVLIGLGVTGFAVFWVAAAYLMTRDNADGIFFLLPYFGVPFVFLGIVIVFLPLLGYFFHVPTVYALTDRRVLAIAGRRQQIVRSTDLSTIAGLSRNEWGEGVGDIVFGFPEERSLSWKGPINGIYGVPRLRQVAEEIERARQHASRGSEVAPFS